VRILFEIDGVEHEGLAEQVSELGAFVLSDQQTLPQEITLKLQDEANSVDLTGEVVRKTSQGFAVAFHALQPETIERLDRLLRPDEAGPEAEEEGEESTGETPAFTIQGEDWTPPVTEPVLHHWKPDGDLLPPPAEGPDGPAWENLPTLSPTIEHRAPHPKAVPLKEPAPPPAEKPTPPPEPKQPEPAPEPPPQAAPEPAPEPTGAERRETERIDQSFPIAFDTLTHLIKEFTHNISFGGMFVYTARPLQKGEETAVTLVHPVHEERCTLLAKVVHSSDAPSPDPITGAPRYGVGVEFRMPLDELKRVLSDFISSHQQQPAQPAPTAQVIGDARAVLQRGEDSRHALLGVDTEAPLDEIRRAYFQLVDRFHPDRYFGKVTKADQKVLEELFRQLTKAYEELTT
jgi:hypothetical protein